MGTDLAVVRGAKAADIWGRVSQARAELSMKEDACPANAFTVSEYSERFGVSRATAEYQVEKLVKAGKLATGKQMRLNSYNRRLLVNVYWPK